MKLEDLVGKHTGQGRKSARQAILAGRVAVGGEIHCLPGQNIDRFQLVTLDGLPLRPAEPELYVMVHKPAGYLCATKDDLHPVILDLLDHPEKARLHVAGRLDRASTGLVILTNNGNWSKQIMSADKKVAKAYLVETVEPITPGAVDAFAQGFYFHTENITTRPAGLEIVSECKAIVILEEGRYHQIKRMFHRVGNRVRSLHRFRIGHITLDSDLAPGEWRHLRADEVAG